MSKKNKKHIGLLLIIAMLVSICPVSARAEEKWETESNNTAEDANGIATGEAICGTLKDGGDVDYYKFTIPSDGKIEINFSHEKIEYTDYSKSISIKDSNQDEIVKYTLYGDKNNIGKRELGLPAGTYYVKIGKGGSNSRDNKYTLKINFEQTSSWEKEINNTKDTADQLGLNQPIYGTLKNEDDVDYFRFELPQSGKIEINFSHEKIEYTDYSKSISIKDSNLDEIVKYTLYGDKNNIGKRELGLPAGTYYVKIGKGGSHVRDNKYTLKINFEQTLSWEKEINNTKDTANQLVLGQPIYGTLKNEDDVDYFRVEIPQDGKIEVNFNHEKIEYTDYSKYVSIKDSNLDEIAKYTLYGDKNNIGKKELGLPAGTYYVKIGKGGSNVRDNKYTLKINFEQTSSWEKEFNDSKDTSDNIYINSPIHGTMRYKDDKDYYKLRLADKETISINFEHDYYEKYDFKWYLTLLDSDLDEIDKVDIANDDYGFYLGRITLSPGTYYFKVTGYYPDDSTYVLSLSTVGWKYIDGNWKYFYYDGSCATDWNYIDGNWYYFRSDGSMHKGWLQYGSKWYYMNSAGEMVIGWKYIDGRWYFFDSNGYMVTGWMKQGGHWYYFNSNGAMVTGWAVNSGKWYYFDSNGYMVTGWHMVNGEWYFFNSSGAMQTGWVKIQGSWYYFYGDGHMATNTYIGNSYVDSNGVWR